jgi:hypothetical protein
MKKAAWKSLYPLNAGLLHGLNFDPEDGSSVSPKRRTNFTGIHGVISQKAKNSAKNP